MVWKTTPTTTTTATKQRRISNPHSLWLIILIKYSTRTNDFLALFHLQLRKVPKIDRQLFNKVFRKNMHIEMHLKMFSIQFLYSEFSWRGKKDEQTLNIYVYLIVWIHYSLLTISAIFIAFLYIRDVICTCCPYKCITYAGFQQIKKVPKAHEIRSETIAIGAQVYFIDSGSSGFCFQPNMKISISISMVSFTFRWLKSILSSHWLTHESQFTTNSCIWTEFIFEHLPRFFSVEWLFPRP